MKTIADRYLPFLRFLHASEPLVDLDIGRGRDIGGRASVDV
jgi:hypothetical protein